MKKQLLLVLAAVFLMTCAGCGNEESGEHKESADASGTSTSQTVSTDGQSEDKTSAASQNSQTSQASQSDGVLLMKSFGELWMGDAYYIDVMMTQEYDPSKLTSAASESSSSLKKVTYDYVIAVDFENNMAGLIMMSDRGSQCNVVKDHELYTINHTDKTYTHSLYDGEAEDFGEEFTVQRCLGIINNCTFVESGTSSYNNVPLQYEKYTLKSQLAGVKDPDITYFFSTTGQPVAELVETESGTTTFEFRKVSNKIEVADMLSVPSDYKDVS